MSHESAGVYRDAATFATIIVLALGVCAPVAAADLTHNSAVDNPARSAKFVARDKVRHPLDELAFFGVRHSRPWSRYGGAAATGRKFLRPSCKTTAPTMSRCKGKEEARLRTLKRTS